MPDPNIGLCWGNLETRLVRLLELPHNKEILQGKAPQQRARQIMAEIENGFKGIPQPEVFQGPRRFLRAVGPHNNMYGGSWWFEEDVLLRLESQFNRIRLADSYRKQAVRNRLRSLLAVSVNWNPMSEIWIYELPGGERITGLVGEVTSQPVYAKGHPDYDPTKVLIGGARQIYFPVKDPFWIARPY